MEGGGRKKLHSTDSISSLISWPWNSHENAGYDASSMGSSIYRKNIRPTISAQASLSDTAAFKLQAVDGRPLDVDARDRKSICVEHLIREVVRALNVEPLAAHLFGIYSCRDGIWLAPCREIRLDSQNDRTLQLRIRFFCDYKLLAERDAAAFEYLFLQYRQDFIDGQIEDFFDQSDVDCLPRARGLAVLDMVRVIKEEGLSSEQVIKSWQKRFIPQDLQKRNGVQQKLKASLASKMSTKHLKDAVDKLADEYKNGPKSIFLLKKQFVWGLMEHSGHYVCEHFSCQLGVNPNLPVNKVRLNILDELITLERREGDKWIPYCRLTDICDINLIPEKIACHINRISGQPLCFRFSSTAALESFISLLDGYFRFTHKFYYDVCRALCNPSLQVLRSEKCHGPMEKDMMYEKLHGKPEGTFALSQSTDMYNTFRIDVAGNVEQPFRSFVIDTTCDGHYRVRKSKVEFRTLSELLTYYKSPHDGILLKECLRPHENELIGLKLFPSSCDNAKDTGRMYDTGNFSVPLCIPPSGLTYPSPSHVHDGEHSQVRRGCLKISDRKSVDVAVKSLSSNVSMESAQKWLAGVQTLMHLSNSAMLIRFYGILLNPLSFVTEYFPLGNVLQFLQQKRALISLRNLLDIATQIAKTLWWLDEQKAGYGPIRAKNVFVADYLGESVKVVVGPIGLGSESVHWVGLDSKGDANDAWETLSHSDRGNWGYGTFLWELFTFGQVPLLEISDEEAESLYRNGYRLEKPSICPEDVYRLMERCWHNDPLQRPAVDVILREMNKVLHLLYDESKPLYPDGTIEIGIKKESKQEFLLRVTGNCLKHRMQTADLNLNNFLGERETNGSPYDPWLIEETALKVVDRLGEGRYGEVNKALYTDPLSDDEPRVVAVKQLKQIKGDRTFSRIMDEMRDEMNIMKSLQHENIVETVGMVLDPVPLLVMEFVQNGALSLYLRNHQGGLSPTHLLQFATDVASGMAYLQSKDIVHRDLAARNILVTAELRGKISDFGLARFMDTGGYYLTQNFGRSIPLAWYAPEVIDYHKYSSKSDSWSFGVLCWEMFTFAAPPYFCDLANLSEKLKEGVRLAQPALCPDEIYVIMRSCWEYEAAKRPDFVILYRTFFDLLQQA
ncbi:tyrosine-protein kinase JAK2-like [Paramacrobiotus metropolitanus]|uniref:tyrosine-protein kinase JAK2-like n=1 Tax=Paramacrobiotus metropolitanus TaxID=2943436 RepID=UPI002445BAC3|nr:tyrosine-protein kinase JAK2-like [Paramacrobiotus metropolitanus]